MSNAPFHTCWTLIHAVHRGDQTARTSFAERYRPTIHKYFEARWRKAPMRAETDDAVQEVFVRCFSDHGPLERATSEAEGGFRGFLYGICRNVARELESKRRGRHEVGAGALDALLDDEPRLSTIFDRAFARTLMRDARDLFHERSLAGGGEAMRRFEILGQRFEENLPIRTIAARRGLDPAKVHKEYARARAEFREALLDVVRDQNPNRTDQQIDSMARRLVQLLA